MQFIVIVVPGMYKKEIMGNNNMEHLFSPPLSFAPSRSQDRGGLFLVFTDPHAVFTVPCRMKMG